MSQGLWWASTQRPPSWLAFSLRPGMVEKDLTGQPKAELLSVRTYPYYSASQYDTYLDLKLKVSGKLKTGSVNFNRSTLAVGAPIELAFPTVEISGTVMQLSAKPFSDKLKWHTITLIKNNAYQWEYDAITIGDQYQDGQESVLEILDKQIVTNMMYPIDYYGAYGERSTMSLISQPRYQITVRAKIKVSQTQEGLVYGHEQELKLGKGMNLSTQNFLFQDFQLAGINTN
ncbi:hypothetical protein A2313_00895 [Candidatus Roizmanbacteria bacterium RIFOXYB2_FULL_41_10]|nr:MAG: hypothetical protein A2262_03710 [Candidatus Roizmanbacteria bacterium RIFOXYA2_FULL_41_8]OGK67250.1 MAG: hypothetical protein A2377_01390 [Candidatus Roizmanbacteria bacterium RIFOXYB1_FULL_41_27]OGK69322.1 MAG: hypothetical protein A2313_00895 [Candidatus Roizmanbacteria bacterium RIFOXYB2_FULL_41_10]OGK71780.1 MAG: hypothetical protein A2403_00260 [Candidatus Roizmanbacteria bacterium RIFOXYC1_FULL_41_16]OGK74837.1 MAG: hypothetical protein A2575_00640 [Candidatus Roizmanbacteria bac